MRDALTTLDRVISAGDGKVVEELVREQLGIVPAVRVKGVLDSLLSGDARAILDHCDALAAIGTDWASFWKELMLSFRDHLEGTTRTGAQPHEILRLSRMLGLLLQRERDLRDSGLPQVVVELALLTASQLPHLEPLDSLVRASGSAAAPAPPTSPRQYPPPPPPVKAPPLPERRPAAPAAQPQKPTAPPPVQPRPAGTIGSTGAADAMQAEELVRQEPPLGRLLKDVSGTIVEIREDEGG
jgi:DNA polymerase-3 subunit gamma/tau